MRTGTAVAVVAAAMTAAIAALYALTRFLTLD